MNRSLFALIVSGSLIADCLPASAQQLTSSGSGNFGNSGFRSVYTATWEAHFEDSVHFSSGSFVSGGMTYFDSVDIYLAGGGSFAYADAGPFINPPGVPEAPTVLMLWLGLAAVAGAARVGRRNAREFAPFRNDDPASMRRSRRDAVRPNDSIRS